MTVIIFLIVLAALIFVHELGHFLAAKAFGIRVDAFKIGFGPKLIAWRFPSKHVITTGQTEYGVNLIPFGGYVKIFGEDPTVEAITGPDAKRSFVNKARWKQAIVLVAGVLFNFIFAWALYSGAFMSGVTATTDGFERYAADFRDPRIMITDVLPGSPADKAGLAAGDVITEIQVPASVTSSSEDQGSFSRDIKASDGTLTTNSIPAAINASDGSPIMVLFTRGAVASSTMAVPETGLVADKFAVGIAMDNVVDLRLPFLASLREGAVYTWVMMKETAVGLVTFIANIFQGTANFSDVSGPVGIAGIVGSAAQLGFVYLVMITALISINLGIINLIPFPALDGGRILFVAIEGVFRRHIPSKFANAVNTVGFVLLMILMVAVTWKDVAKLIK